MHPMLSVRRSIREALLPLGVLLAGVAIAAPGPLNELFSADKFRQLEEVLPTPNDYRVASGAPGHRYWQQQVDYDIDVALDEDSRHIRGSERITYHNRSPDTLRYLWVQLDPNIFAPESHAAVTRDNSDLSRLSYERMGRLLRGAEFDGRCRINRVAQGAIELRHTIVDTLMRVDLPEPLAAGADVQLAIDWDYAINDHDVVGGRTGFEHFDQDGNCIFEIAQWFPRLCVYSDATGWQNKTFLGSGEFTLEFGDYHVRIDVPADHIVTATGVLQNPEEVLSTAQRERLLQAETAAAPVFIVTPEEARENQQQGSSERRTWEFRADNVRDFSFASSRKFIWDAALHPVAGGHPVWCMSFYPNEAEPLWSRYSTAAIMHTLDVYSRFTFAYPYPVAISVNGPVGGMEYPMICFNGPRPEEDGTYSARTKYGLISVVIHEVGHNYFPMVVNSDERQWTWMDEGLNTFLQFQAEREWQRDYPSDRGEPKDIVNYMKSTEQVPVMTASDSLVQFGSNAYAKPATALNVLRETVLGRELFDFAFKEYANRWAFKHPLPADFFRTLEDASGVDLDWFWRGWFYTTERVDVAIASVRLATIDSRDPQVEKARKREAREREPITMIDRRNHDLVRLLDRFPALADFYNEYDDLAVREGEVEAYQKLLKDLKPEEIELLGQDLRLYTIELRNVGGLVTPVILLLRFADGSEQELRIPAELWRRDSAVANKLIVTRTELLSVELDPHLETADVDRSNNYFPPRIDEDRLELQPGRKSSRNPMQEAREREEKAKKASEARPADAGTDPPAGASGG